MIEFSLNANTDEWKANEEECKFVEDKGFTALFENLFVGLIKNKYPEGVPSENIKTVHRIFKKLDETTQPNIQVESSEIDFLEDIFVTSKLPIPPNIIRLYMIYKTEVQRCVSKITT